MYKWITLLLCSLLLNSCSMEPEAIAFGTDQCHYCKMTIVDKTHASQYVTSKGKQFKFDAIECMVNELNEHPDKSPAILLVSDYGKPGTMIAATEATYLISKAIKSPMGAFLTAFAERAVAEKVIQDSEGQIYSWDELKAYLREN